MVILQKHEGIVIYWVWGGLYISKPFIGEEINVDIFSFLQAAEDKGYRVD